MYLGRFSPDAIRGFNDVQAKLRSREFVATEILHIGVAAYSEGADGVPVDQQG